MHDIRNQDDRNRQICQRAVRLLNQRQQAELRNAEIHDAANQRHGNLAGGNLPALRLLRAGFLQAAANALDHGSDHINRGGYRAENNQNGNQRRQDVVSHAVLYHEQRRYALIDNVRIGADGQQTQNHHDHEQRIDYPADAHALDGIVRLFKRLGVLDKHRDIGELEGAIQKCRIQRLAERRRLCGHRVHGLRNGAGACDNVRNVHDQQTGNDADGQNRSNLAHKIRAENRHDENKRTDQQRAQQIRQAGQCAQRGAAGCKRNGRCDTHDAQI